MYGANQIRLHWWGFCNKTSAATLSYLHCESLTRTSWMLNKQKCLWWRENWDISINEIQWEDERRHGSNELSLWTLHGFHYLSFISTTEKIRLNYLWTSETNLIKYYIIGQYHNIECRRASWTLDALQQHYGVLGKLMTSVSIVFVLLT